MQGFHRSLGADGHENRCLNLAVGQGERAGAGGAIGRMDGERHFLLRYFFHVTGFERDREAVHAAVDFVITIDDADGLGFRAGLEGFRGAFEF